MKVEDNLLFVTEVEKIPLAWLAKDVAERGSDAQWSGDVRIVAARISATSISDLIETTRLVNGQHVPIARVEAVVHVGADGRMPQKMDRVRLVVEVVPREEGGGL